jgi:hypothetical protein
MQETTVKAGGKQMVSFQVGRVTTDGQSASLFVKPLLRPKTDFSCCHTVAVLSMWATGSVEKTGLSFLAVISVPISFP